MAGFYLALGDSITAGYGVGNRNFAALYYWYLLKINPNLRFVNFGIMGLTTNQLAYILLTNAHLLNLIRLSDIITLTIGSNDLLRAGVCYVRGQNANVLYAISNMERNLEFIGQQIRQLNPRALVKVATIYNPLPAGPYYQYSGQAQIIITQANKMIMHWAKKYGFKVIPLDKVFQGREHLFLGTDCIHPNLLGHQIIAMEYSR